MSKLTIPESKLKWILLIFLAMVWGSSMILIKLSLRSFSAMQVGTLRVLITALFMLLIGYKYFRELEKERIPHYFVSGLTANLLPALLFSVAQTHLDSSISATLNSFTPFSTAMVGYVFFSRSLSKTSFLGLSLGLVGALAIITFDHGEFGISTNIPIFYTSLVFLATICYGFNLNWITTHLSDVSAKKLTFFNFMSIALIALIILLVTDLKQLIYGFNVVANPHAMSSTLAIVVLSVLGTGLSLILFFKLLKMSNPTFSSSVTYLIPIVAIILGVLDGESIHWIQIMGLVLILLSIRLID